MNIWTVDRAAEVLLAAEHSGTARTPLTDEWHGLDMEASYRIQDAALGKRLARGETLIGVKLGLTSRAKQQRMGIDRPAVAWLTDAMVLPTGTPVPIEKLIHPRVEPEIVFVMGERLTGPGVTAPRALHAVSSVHAGLEVIDSRFAGFHFTLPDTIADNCSSGLFICGSGARDPLQTDLGLEACLLEVDGEIVDTATGAAVQGHPAEALAWAANTLAERGLALEPGWLVLTGGMTDAVPITVHGQIATHFSTLGSISVTGGSPCRS